MLKKIVNIVVLIPIGIVLIVLSVANRQTVTLALNPFNPADKLLAASAPFFVFLFLAVIFGMIVGGFAVWFSQGKYRKRARNEAHEAVKWHAEAEKARTRADGSLPRPALSARTR